MGATGKVPASRPLRETALARYGDKGEEVINCLRCPYAAPESCCTGQESVEGGPRARQIPVNGDPFRLPIRQACYGSLDSGPRGSTGTEERSSAAYLYH